MLLLGLQDSAKKWGDVWNLSGKGCEAGEGKETSTFSPILTTTTLPTPDILRPWYLTSPINAAASQVYLLTIIPVTTNAQLLQRHCRGHNLWVGKGSRSLIEQTCGDSELC